MSGDRPGTDDADEQLGGQTGELTAARPLPDATRDPGAPAPWPPPSRYGGRSVAIANDAGRVVEHSVASLAEMPDDLPPHALVGGLAVMIRLYEAHRVTTDFDEVSQSPEEVVAALVLLGAQRTSKGVAIVERGVQLDLLDAQLDLAELAAIEPTLDGDDERRAWQLATGCRYALETAVDTSILVIDGERVVAEVTLPVAMAGSLVALKALAAVAPDRDPDKSAADIYDAWRLVRAWGPAVIAEDLARAPLPMLRTVADQVQHLFGDEVERSAHRLRRASVPGVDAVDLLDLEATSVLVEHLDPFLQWDEPMG